MTFSHFKRNIRQLIKTLYHKLPFLVDTVLAMNIRLYVCAILNTTYGIRESAISFYNQNAQRVNAVANMLADKKSKKIYLGMIRFRQTSCRRDFPFHYIEEIQYFFRKLKLGSEEVFIDGGAFVGDTIDLYLKHRKKCKQIIAFEPDSKNFNILKEKHGNNPSITLIDAGLYNEDGIISFSSANSGFVSCGCEMYNDASKITNNDEGEKIQVRSIDGLGLERVTFIKMDIEGAELNALKGAKETILRDKPKLAICLYHSDEDMLSIPEYIHNLVPQYRLYVRHYTYQLAETILYAVMP
jgi:FkbM family methyltransferase